MTKVWVLVAYGSALVSYNFAQQAGWSFARSGAPRAKLQATWWQNASAARSSLPTLLRAKLQLGVLSTDRESLSNRRLALSGATTLLHCATYAELAGASRASPVLGVGPLSVVLALAHGVI